MLELGFSKPWQDAMEKITGQRNMDTAGLLEYFKPLTEWLTEENKKTNEYIGWKSKSKGIYFYNAIHIYLYGLSILVVKTNIKIDI